MTQNRDDIASYGEQIDVIPLPGGGENRLPAFPMSFSEALSLIQEQAAFETDVPGDETNESYGGFFTIQHAISFLYVGFRAAAMDSFIAALGFLLYEMATHGHLTVFGHDSPGMFDRTVALGASVIPFAAAYFLLLRVIAKLTGPISRKMMVVLATGLTTGLAFWGFAMYLTGHAVALDLAPMIFRHLEDAGTTTLPLLETAAYFFWDVLRPLLIEASTRECFAAVSMILAVWFSVTAKLVLIKRERENAAF